MKPIPKCRKTVSGEHHWEKSEYEYWERGYQCYFKYKKCRFCGLIDDTKETK